MEKEKVRLEKLSLDLKLKPDATDAAVIDSGWKPVEQNSNKTDADDPMLQQINIIRGYVKQAKQAQKFDEVKMLEDNLRELQHEWWKQQNEARKFSSWIPLQSLSGHKLLMTLLHEHYRCSNDPLGNYCYVHLHVCPAANFKNNLHLETVVIAQLQGKMIHVKTLIISKSISWKTNSFVGHI